MKIFKSLLVATVIAIFFGVLKAEAAFSHCSFEGIEARVQIAVSTQHKVYSVLTIDKQEIEPMHESCTVNSSNRVNERAINCMHETEDGSTRYIVYPRLNQITHKVDKISMIVWRGDEPALYTGKCD